MTEFYQPHQKVWAYQPNTDEWLPGRMVKSQPVYHSPGKHTGYVVAVPRKFPGDGEVLGLYHPWQVLPRYDGQKAPVGDPLCAK